MLTYDGGETWHRDSTFPAFEYAEGIQYDKRGNIWIGSSYGAIYTTMDTAGLSSAIISVPGNSHNPLPISTISKHIYIGQNKSYSSGTRNRFNILGRMCRKSSRNKTPLSGIIIEETNHKILGKTRAK